MNVLQKHRVVLCTKKAYRSLIVLFYIPSITITLQILLEESLNFATKIPVRLIKPLGSEFCEIAHLHVPCRFVR